MKTNKVIGKEIEEEKELIDEALASLKKINKIDTSKYTCKQSLNDEKIKPSSHKFFKSKANAEEKLSSLDLISIKSSADRFDRWMKKYRRHDGTHNEELIDWLSADGGAKKITNYYQFSKLAEELLKKGYETDPLPSEDDFKKGIEEYKEKLDLEFIEKFKR